MEQDRIKRIQQMEEVYDRVKKVVDNLDDAFTAYEDIQKDIPVLAEYEETGLWLEDYGADEQGLIPKDLKRGVLAQDTLDDLFVKIVCLHNKFKEFFKDWNEFDEDDLDNVG